MKIRKPAVAGVFYPSCREELNNLLGQLDRNVQEISLPDKFSVFGGVVPHAGYIYSGAVAMSFFNIVSRQSNLYDTVVIIHPNHDGIGPDIAIDASDEWETPLGNVEVDKTLCHALQTEISNAAHVNEHSAEVMIPFLQYKLSYRFGIVAVAMRRQNPETAIVLAEKLNRARQITGKRLLVIASNDFSHFVSVDQGIALDNKVIPHILSHDHPSIYATVTQHKISMCGYGPVMTLAAMSKELQPPVKTRILERGHSGMVHYSNRVVHYLSVLYYQENDK